jgi:hypothetical protein
MDCGQAARPKVLLKICVGGERDLSNRLLGGTFGRPLTSLYKPTSVSRLTLRKTFRAASLYFVDRVFDYLSHPLSHPKNHETQN